jgi:hypothetical protein
VGATLDAIGAEDAEASADSPADGGPESTKRGRARRIYAELSADGAPVSGARLAQAADLSPSYARMLAAEFAAELPRPAQRNGHHDTPPDTLVGLDPEAIR